MESDTLSRIAKGLFIRNPQFDTNTTRLLKLGELDCICYEILCCSAEVKQTKRPDTYDENL